MAASLPPNSRVSRFNAPAALAIMRLPVGVDPVLYPRSATICSFILNFCIFPVTVIGNSSTNLMTAGILKWVILSRQ